MSAAAWGAPAGAPPLDAVRMDVARKNLDAETAAIARAQVALDERKARVLKEMDALDRREAAARSARLRG